MKAIVTNIRKNDKLVLGMLFIILLVISFIK